MEANYKVGTFTSPHILDFRERIAINDQLISKEAVISFCQKIQKSFRKKFCSKSWKDGATTFRWMTFSRTTFRKVTFVKSGYTKGGSITVLLTSCLTGLESAVWQLAIFCFYLQNRLIQTSQTGGQWYSDTSPFSIPWSDILSNSLRLSLSFYLFIFSLYLMPGRLA